MSIKIEDCNVIFGIKRYEIEYKNICITLNEYNCFCLYWADSFTSDFYDYSPIEDYTNLSDDEIFQQNLVLSFSETDLYTIIDIQKLLYSLRGNNGY